MVTVRSYRTADGHVPFEEWLLGLKDIQARGRIRARLARIQGGNFGDCKPLRDGILELRIDHGPGYRVYLSRQGPLIILLLYGSNKAGQREAIKRALKYLRDWQTRGES